MKFSLQSILTKLIQHLLIFSPGLLFKIFQNFNSKRMCKVCYVQVKKTPADLKRLSEK